MFNGKADNAAHPNCIGATLHGAAAVEGRGILTRVTFSRV